MPTLHVPLCETLAISDGRDENNRGKMSTSNYIEVPTPCFFISCSKVSTIVTFVDIDTGDDIRTSADRGL